MKKFQFTLTLFGQEKVFNVNGKDYEDARKRLDANILKCVNVTSHKVIKELDPVKEKNPIDQISDMFDKGMGNLGDLFKGLGKKK